MGTTATAAYAHDTTLPTAGGVRSPLPWLVLLSLLLHAAILALWPPTTLVVPDALPAGPIALQLQHSQTGIAPTARVAPAPAPQPPPNRAVKQHTPPPKHLARAIPQAHARAPSASASADRAETVVASDSQHPTPRSRAQAVNATGTAHGEALRAQLSSRLQHALIAHFEYPLTARRRGWEGVVRVGLRVEADGQLSALRVIGSSGHALLDRAALASLHRVGRLPDVAGWMQGRRLDMVLPVRYQLIDS